MVRPCIILGNSPSLLDHDLDRCKDYFTIGINRSFKPYISFNPTVLFFQDKSLILSDYTNIMNIDSILFMRKSLAPKKFPHKKYFFKIKSGPFKHTVHARVLKGFGASAPLAYQLAHVLKYDPIIILGCDCCYRDTTNFYGNNHRHSENTIVNCNKGLKFMRKSGCYESLDILDNYKPKKDNRNKFIERMKKYNSMSIYRKWAAR